MEKIDIAIIGAGIIGLQLANKILEENPNCTVCIFEQENFLGEHTSGRNSGVIHSGIYYATNSLKHKLCLEGNLLWEKLSAQLDIPINFCGKYIIAKNIEENTALLKLKDLAERNSVLNIYFDQANLVNELTHFFEAHSALYLPRTGIIDQSTAISKVRDFIESRGGIILLRHKLIKLKLNNSKVEMIFNNKLEVQASKIINCAGLSAVNIRKNLGLSSVEDYWVKGSYIKSQKKNSFSKLVYPVPLKDLKGLGIHLTFDFNNTLKFGPNTEEVDIIDYQVNTETVNEMSNNVKKFVKNFNLGSLSADYAGIRPKIKVNNSLYQDFWIKEPLENYIELLGIESPGFTASPAIANYVYDNFLKNS